MLKCDQELVPSQEAPEGPVSSIKAQKEIKKEKKAACEPRLLRAAPATKCATILFNFYGLQTTQLVTFLLQRFQWTKTGWLGVCVKILFLVGSHQVVQGRPGMYSSCCHLRSTMVRVSFNLNIQRLTLKYFICQIRERKVYFTQQL